MSAAAVVDFLAGMCHRRLAFCVSGDVSAGRLGSDELIFPRNRVDACAAHGHDAKARVIARDLANLHCSIDYGGTGKEYLT